MTAPAPIPRLLHQTWKDHDVPVHWQAWQRSWRTHHPAWEFKLWTDADNRRLIDTHYRWFLPIYDGYREPIMRADAIRYFLLHRFGGVYADLDFECRRPIEPLLEEGEVVLGTEPPEHIRLVHGVADLERFVCNAWMASTAGHPFWEHVIHELVGAHKAAGPLDATGPFLLTRAVASYRGPGSIRVLPSPLLYPLRSPACRELLPPGAVDESTAEAFAVHHWAGSWSHDPSRIARGVANSVSVRVVDGLAPVLAADVDLEAQRARWDRDGQRPLVSCLMVTGARPALAARAVACFRNQTYPARELVIVDDGADDSLAHHLAALADPTIRHLRLPSEGKLLGELRNLAVAEARGELVAQWDDDDLSDPARLEVQLATIAATRAEACMLASQLLWWPEEQRLGVSGQRPWEGSFVCARAVLPKYPARRRGEDTPVVTTVLRRRRVAVLNEAGLYTYVFHGANTFDRPHFEELWRASGLRFEGLAYRKRLLELAAQVPIDLGPALAPSLAASPPAAVVAIAPPIAPPPTVTTARPRVLIATPAKNAARFVPAYVANLQRLEYDPAQLSVALLEGDSTDDTYPRLAEAVAELGRTFRRAELIKRDHGYHLPGPRWAAAAQRQRRSILAQCRNELLARALDDEEWVLWIDIDVTSFPPEVLERLLATGRSIVAPHCVTHPGGPSFDLNTWLRTREETELDRAAYVVDGLLQPPRGHGRRYLDELRDRDLVQVDAVGGAMLLVRADLHRQGLIFPPVPYELLIETEGFARMASALGHACWALPRLEVVHPPHG